MRIFLQTLDFRWVNYLWWIFCLGSNFSRNNFSFKLFFVQIQYAEYNKFGEGRAGWCRRWIGNTVVLVLDSHTFSANKRIVFSVAKTQICFIWFRGVQVLVLETRKMLYSLTNDTSWSSTLLLIFLLLIVLTSCVCGWEYIEWILRGSKSICNQKVSDNQKLINWYIKNKKYNYFKIFSGISAYRSCNVHPPSYILEY